MSMCSFKRLAGLCFRSETRPDARWDGMQGPDKVEIRLRQDAWLVLFLS